MVYTATDREQIDELKKWWNDYGKTIGVAVMIGLAVGGVWRYCHNYVLSKEQAASQIFQSMTQAASEKQASVVAQYITQLQHNYPKTTYAVLGSFVDAQFNIAAAHYAVADTDLRWVIANSRNPSLKQVARLRDARVLLQLSKPDDALAVLTVLNDAAYQPMIDQIKGDAYLAQHKAVQSAAAYQSAKVGYDVAGMTNPLLDLYIAN